MLCKLLGNIWISDLKVTFLEEEEKFKTNKNAKFIISPYFVNLPISENV